MDWLLTKLRQLGDFGIGRVLPGIILLVIGILMIRIILRLIRKALERTAWEKAAHNLILSVVRIALYLLQVWSKTSDYWTTLCAVNKNIKTVFDAKGIKLAYPHMNVHMDK